MKARIRDASEAAAIEAAADLLRRGGLVAFPTETVYGLGVNALDADAVERLFAAKGRPSSNPLIVHVADVMQARRLASAWSPLAERLAVHFWPGPLTLVVPKGDWVPGIVTAGGGTVGLRVPAHPAALALLRATRIPVAAPSANRSEEVSPTTAQHVADSLGDHVDLILDGGPTEVGLESTVLDVTTDPPRVLRPGMVTAEMLRAVVDVGAGSGGEAVSRSPGLLPRHYAPRAPVVIVPPEDLAATLRPGDGRLVMPPDAAGYATRLYAALREMDAAGVSRIVVEEPPDGPEWEAVHDRLRRAVGPPA